MWCLKVFFASRSPMWGLKVFLGRSGAKGKAGLP